MADWLALMAFKVCACRLRHWESACVDFCGNWIEYFHAQSNVSYGSFHPIPVIQFSVYLFFNLRFYRSRRRRRILLNFTAQFIMAILNRWTGKRASPSTATASATMKPALQRTGSVAVMPLWALLFGGCCLTQCWSAAEAAISNRGKCFRICFQFIAGSATSEREALHKWIRKKSANATRVPYDFLPSLLERWTTEHFRHDFSWMFFSTKHMLGNLYENVLMVRWMVCRYASPVLMYYSIINKNDRIIIYNISRVNFGWHRRQTKTTNWYIPTFPHSVSHRSC